jgi:hypothetical protein
MDRTVDVEQPDQATKTGRPLLGPSRLNEPAITSAASSTTSSRAPKIPALLKIQEVAVETQDEGSSNEGTDNEETFGEASGSTRAPMLDADDDPELQALVRGPVLRWDRSVLDDLPSGAEEGGDKEDNDLIEDAGAQSEEDDDGLKLEQSAGRFVRRRIASVTPSEESSDEPVRANGKLCLPVVANSKDLRAPTTNHVNGDATSEVRAKCLAN